MTAHHVEDVPCDALVELVTDYLEGALDDATRTRLELHLVLCAGCEAYVGQMRRTIDVVRVAGSAGDDAARERAVADGLLAAFRGWRGGPPHREDEP